MAPNSIDPESDQCLDSPQLQPWTKSPSGLDGVISIAFCLCPHFCLQPFTLKTGQGDYLKTCLRSSRSAVQTLSMAPTLLRAKGSIPAVCLRLTLTNLILKIFCGYTGLCCSLYPLDTLLFLHFLFLVPAILFLQTYAILGRLDCFLPVKSD